MMMTNIPNKNITNGTNDLFKNIRIIRYHSQDSLSMIFVIFAVIRSIRIQ